MNNTFLEKINQATKHQPPARDKNLVAFLAIRHDVKIALDAGYSGKTVWRQLQHMQIVDFGYETFLNYVKRYLRTPPSLQSSAPTPTQPILPAEPGAAPKIIQAALTASFTFNPVPNKEELL